MVYDSSYAVGPYKVLYYSQKIRFNIYVSAFYPHQLQGPVSSGKCRLRISRIYPSPGYASLGQYRLPLHPCQAVLTKVKRGHHL